MRQAEAGTIQNYCISLTSPEPSVISDAAPTGALATPVSSPTLDAPPHILAQRWCRHRHHGFFGGFGFACSSLSILASRSDMVACTSARISSCSIRTQK